MAVELWEELESSQLILNAFAIRPGLTQLRVMGNTTMQRGSYSGSSKNAGSWIQRMQGSSLGAGLDDFIRCSFLRVIYLATTPRPGLSIAQARTKHAYTCGVRLNQMPEPSAFWRTLHMFGKGTSRVPGRYPAWLWMQLLKATSSLLSSQAF
jgi:hypothetical protein